MCLKIRIFTVRKRSLRRLCFYTCLSVHRGQSMPRPGGCPGTGPGVCLPGDVHAQAWGVSMPRPGGVQTQVQGVSRPMPRGGVYIPAFTEADTPPADGYRCGRYASYWNAFLFILDLYKVMVINVITIIIINV